MGLSEKSGWNMGVEEEKDRGESKKECVRERIHNCNAIDVLP